MQSSGQRASPRRQLVGLAACRLAEMKVLLVVVYQAWRSPSMDRRLLPAVRPHLLGCIVFEHFLAQQFRRCIERCTCCQHQALQPCSCLKLRSLLTPFQSPPLRPLQMERVGNTGTRAMEGRGRRSGNVHLPCLVIWAVLTSIALLRAWAPTMVRTVPCLMARVYMFILQALVHPGCWRFLRVLLLTPPRWSWAGGHAVIYTFAWLVASMFG